jgi:hypothetical protein
MQRGYDVITWACGVLIFVPYISYAFIAPDLASAMKVRGGGDSGVDSGGGDSGVDCSGGKGAMFEARRGMVESRSNRSVEREQRRIAFYCLFDPNCRTHT